MFDSGFQWIQKSSLFPLLFNVLLYNFCLFYWKRSKSYAWRLMEYLIKSTVESNESTSSRDNINVLECSKQKIIFESQQFRIKKSQRLDEERLEDCVYCGKTFTHKALIRHKAEEEKILRCRYCEKNFETVQLFRRHTYRYHKYYSCKICNLKFLKGAYEYHMSSVHRGRPECKICNKTFATKLSLVAHEKKIHLGQREHRFQCQQCSYNAPDKFQYEIHIARHNKSPSLVCDHCGTGHYTKSELNKHIQADHCGGYPCELCQKSFRSPEYLKRHKITHEPNYDPKKINFTCEECGTGFLNEFRFKRHLLRHKGEIPMYNCDSCGKSITSKSSFQAHIRMHSGSKPFACNDCGKAFTDKRYLLEHRKHHTGETPFRCDICGQRFTQYGTLSTHKKTHQLESQKLV